ncbi:MAG: ATPase, T2SS/T4P/T4SS family, partial [Patescibacteria group bacterium]|nr:ATPase, T2SS/T4P/T4SS family [Patescibacteria group bacterium]
MSEKIAKTICRYGQAHSHSHLRLENKGDKLLCFYGPGNGAKYLRLDRSEAANIAETFRYLVGAVDNELFVDKRFKIADKDGLISGRATLLPASNGEKLLITLKNSNPQARRLSALGLNRDQQKMLKSALTRKSGVIIITGAEENGISSTYYSLLKEANNNKSAYSLESYPGNHLNGTNVIDPKKYGG